MLPLHRTDIGEYADRQGEQPQVTRGEKLYMGYRIIFKRFTAAATAKMLEHVSTMHFCPCH